MTFEKWMQGWFIAWLMVSIGLVVAVLLQPKAECLSYYVPHDPMNPDKHLGFVLVRENNNWIPYTEEQLLSKNIVERLCK